MTPLRDALVRAQVAGVETLTDQGGRFVLKNLPAGSDTLLVSVVGYGLVRRDVIVVANHTTELSIALAEGSGTFTESVTVAAPAFRRPEPGVASQAVLGSRDLLALRGLVADDPFRAVQTLPGVATGDDFNASFAVRGLGPSETGVSVDGVDSPLLLHTVRGVFDTASLALINSDILDRVTLTAGTRPQLLAPHLGASVAFETRDGSRERTSGRIMGSATAATTVWEGPLGTGKRGSWLVAARRSYIDWLVRALGGDGSQSSFGFTDGQAKFSFDLSPRHTVQASVIAGSLRLREREEDVGPNALDPARSRTVVGNLRWRFAASPTVALTQQLYVVDSRYRNHVPDGRIRELGDDSDVTWRAGARWTVGGRHVIEMGGQAQWLQASRIDRHFPDATTTETEVNISRDGTAHAAWVNARWMPASSVVLSTGGRIDRWAAANGVAATPWILAEWTPRVGTTVRGGMGLQRQGPGLEQATLVSPGVQLTPARVVTLDAGVEQAIGSHWRVSMAAYHRDESDRFRLVTPEWLIANGVVVRRRATGWENAFAGTSDGVEATVERRAPTGWSGMASWALSRSTVTDASRAETFPGDFDQRHTFNAYGLYRWSDRTSVSARLRAGSSFPLAGYFDRDGETYYLGATRNAVRLPTYGRLDIRTDRAFSVGSRRLTLFVEILNVLNRRNVGPSDPSFDTRFGRVHGLVEDLFPVLPTIGLVIEF